MANPAFDVVTIESFGLDNMGPPLTQELNDKLQKLATEVVAENQGKKASAELTVKFAIQRNGATDVRFFYTIKEKHPANPPRDGLTAFISDKKFVTQETRQTSIPMPHNVSPLNRKEG